MNESGMQVEQESAQAIHFCIDMARHGIKGKIKNEDGTIREPLTKEGMMGAVMAGLDKEHLAELGGVYGSPRERTGQSSVFRMFAEQLRDEAHYDFDPEEFVRWLQEGGMGKTETPLLNFQDGDGEYQKEVMDNFGKKLYLKWITERSDAAALEHKQMPDKVTPLSIQAGNVGAFIATEVWGAYAARDRGETVEPRVDFATSHQGVLESFLYKVIKRLEGDEAATSLVTELNNHGFAENQGFKVTVDILDPKDVTNWSITLNYGGKDYKLMADEVFEIIKEGEDLKKQLAELQKEKSA